MYIVNLPLIPVNPEQHEQPNSTAELFVSQNLQNAQFEGVA